MCTRNGQGASCCVYKKLVHASVAINLGIVGAECFEESNTGDDDFGAAVPKVGVDIQRRHGPRLLCTLQKRFGAMLLRTLQKRSGTMLLVTLQKRSDTKLLVMLQVPTKARDTGADDLRAAVVKVGKDIENALTGIFNQGGSKPKHTIV